MKHLIFILRFRRLYLILLHYLAVTNFPQLAIMRSILFCLFLTVAESAFGKPISDITSIEKRNIVSVI
jgi:hypothetical protein